MPKLRRINFIALAGGAALLLAALSVFGAYEGGLSRALDLLGQFALQAGIGALGLTLLFAALRQPALAGASAAVAIAAYFATAVPAPVAPCTNVPTHRVMFFNIWARNQHTVDTVAFIAHQDADTIILAEVNPRFREALGELRKIYPYSMECPEGDVRCQFYVYSRVPIEGKIEPSSHDLIELITTYPEGSVALAGIHAARPVPIVLSGNHAGQPMPLSHRWFQLWQVSFFADRIAQSPQPRLVVGDFNAVSWSAIIKRMSRIAGVKPLPSRGTWLAPLPWPLRLPIDQALVGDGILCATKTVGPTAFSDHRPIWVDFALKPPAATAPAPSN